MKLKTSASEHYTLQLKDLVGEEINSQDFQVLWQALDGDNLDKHFWSLLKMHEGLGHPGREKFHQMLKMTGIYNKNVVIL